jgi:hypothetical protein
MTSYAPVEVSFAPTGGAGSTGVNVDVIFWPVMSCTWYVIGVLFPGVATGSAAKVTTPVDGFNV